MPNLTIRDLDADLVYRLRQRAKNNGRSIEDEARWILDRTLNQESNSRDIASIFRKHFGTTHGINLELPKRDPLPEPPSFDQKASTEVSACFRD